MSLFSSYSSLRRVARRQASPLRYSSSLVANNCEVCKLGFWFCSLYRPYRTNIFIVGLSPALQLRQRCLWLDCSWRFVCGRRHAVVTPVPKPLLGNTENSSLGPDFVSAWWWTGCWNVDGKGNGDPKKRSGVGVGIGVEDV